MKPANAIHERIAEALRRFPPFSMLPESDVEILASQARVRVHAAGECIWSKGDAPGQDAFFLAQGRVEYVLNSELVDVRDVGDILALTALHRSEPFFVTAQVVEDSLFYCLPWRLLNTMLTDCDEARNYLRRHLFWATRVGGSVALPEPTEQANAGRAKNILQSHLDGAQLIQARRENDLLCCSPRESLHNAAILMTARRVPSILVVDEDEHPLGILTHRTLVEQVIAGDVSKEAEVQTVMTSPVVTVADRSSATAAILLMLRRRISLVVITEDGTPDSKVLDIWSEKDLLANSGHHPAGLIREIRRARSAPRFRELCDDIAAISRSYLEAGVSAVFLGRMCGELYDELAQRFIALGLQELEVQGIQVPEIPWAWMAVGSDGRHEQILRTDMDNALVFASQGSEEADEKVREVFVLLASKVVERFVECGFSRCQGGIMASNPRWCRSLQEWGTELESIQPNAGGDQMLRAITLYDLRFVAGDRALCGELSQLMQKSVASNVPLQRRLAGAVVDTPPPLNFFGRFVVEKRGGNENVFDIKQRAMAPLRDAARVLSLRHGYLQHHSTGGRWDEIRRAAQRWEEVAGLARESYDLLLRLRTLNGLRRADSGRYIDPSALTKLERAQLANVFDVVRMVQNSIRFEFELGQ